MAPVAEPNQCTRQKGKGSKEGSIASRAAAYNRQQQFHRQHPRQLHQIMQKYLVEIRLVGGLEKYYQLRLTHAWMYLLPLPFFVRKWKYT